MSVSLPVIVGFGGYNAAGRSSSHQAFRRMILESLPVQQQEITILGLACLMGHITKQVQVTTLLKGNYLHPVRPASNIATECCLAH